MVGLRQLGREQLGLTRPELPWVRWSMQHHLRLHDVDHPLREFAHRSIRSRRPCGLGCALSERVRMARRLDLVMGLGGCPELERGCPEFEFGQILSSSSLRFLPRLGNAWRNWYGWKSYLREVDSRPWGYRTTRRQGRDSCWQISGGRCRVERRPRCSRWKA